MNDTAPPPAIVPLRVLFLCTGNSARSQIAEALLSHKGRGRFVAASAGGHPASRVHPFAVEALRDYGIDWSGAAPKGIDDVRDAGWDLIITVCDRMRERCPTFPGRPVFAHWGMPDPAAVEPEAERRTAFRHVALYLSRRIDLLLAIPFEKLEPHRLEEHIRGIGDAADAAPAADPVTPE